MPKAIVAAAQIRPAPTTRPQRLAPSVPSPLPGIGSLTRSCSAEPGSVPPTGDSGAPPAIAGIGAGGAGSAPGSGRIQTTPIAVEEVFNSLWDTDRLITEQLIDYLRAAVTHAGGITHLRKIAALAEAYHVRIGCHGPTDLSPITMAASAHFNLAVHNFGLHEYVPHSEETDQVFPHAYTVAEGQLHPGDEPGLGVSLDEEAAAKYPYERAYLPVNREVDGTLHSW